MNRKALIAGSAILAGCAALAAVRQRRGMNLRGKVVLITGGSHGLGVALAREFAQAGARLALCARSEEELAAAERDLKDLGGEVFTIRCNVGDRAEAESAVKKTLLRYGQVDVLVNNAGIIRVGPIESMSIEDFQQTMDVMFWGVVYTSLAALPHLRERPESRIVTVTSVGGKVSVPHLLPYSCAKFAATAFSEGLRAELSATSVKVVTIAPGLMRTGSHLSAEFKGDTEAAWFSVAASTPAISMDAARAARQIVAATRAGRAEKILGLPANLIARLNGAVPGFTSDVLGVMNRLLPGGASETKLGSETNILQRPWMRALTVLGRQAAQEFLQPAARGRAAVRHSNTARAAVTNGKAGQSCTTKLIA